METEEEFCLVLDRNTSEPIYDVDGNVLVQRNSDGYEFFVDPEALLMNNAENQSGAALDNHDTVELPSVQSSPSLPLSSNLPIEKHWSHNDILKLIDEYKKNKENFASNAIQNAEVWEQIAKALGSHDAKQCENKLKYLKSKYSKKKDNMSIKQSGAQQINFEYVEVPSIPLSPSLPLSSNLPIEKHWSRNDILKLIDEYKKNKENFASSAIRNVKVWEQIAKALGSHDAKQCENKFKYLKSKYLKKKDNMSIKQSGAERINFEYFDELDEIFRKQPIVVPVIASSSRENPIENIQMDETEREEEANGQEQQQPRTRNIRLRDTLINLNNILKESEENKEKRFKELLSVHKKSLDTFKILMEKMLEKM